MDERLKVIFDYSLLQRCARKTLVACLKMAGLDFEHRSWGRLSTNKRWP